MFYAIFITDGTGEPNPEGIKYYNNLIDALLEKGDSAVTLKLYFHINIFSLFIV